MNVSEVGILSIKNPQENDALRVVEIKVEGGLLHCFGFDGGGVLALFFVRVDAEVDLDAFALCGGLNEAADGGGGEALATDEGGDVGLAEDEAEVDLVLA